MKVGAEHTALEGELTNSNYLIVTASNFLYPSQTSQTYLGNWLETIPCSRLSLIQSLVTPARATYTCKTVPISTSAIYYGRQKLSGVVLHWSGATTGMVMVVTGQNHWSVNLGNFTAPSHPCLCLEYKASLQMKKLHASEISIYGTLMFYLKDVFVYNWKYILSDLWAGKNSN